MRRWATLAAGLSVALIAGCGEPEPSPDLEPAASDPGFFGINGQNLQPMAADGRAARLDRHLSEIARLGLDFVRASFSWPVVEPRAPHADRHGYDFATTDAWVAALARRGLRWYATVKGNPTPSWALGKTAAGGRCGERAPPARAQDFAALAAAISGRYGSDGSFWAEHPGVPHRPLAAIEVWNEPNFGIFWCPSPDPARYASLVSAAVSAIRSSDPEIRIVLGGLAAFRTRAALPGQAPRVGVREFLTGVTRVAPWIDEEIDAVGVHLYADDSAGAVSKLAWLREAADASGLAGLPLSVSEVGWRVRGGVGSVTEKQRTALLQEAALGVAVSGCGISELAAHTWITAERDPLDPEDWFGLADPVTAEPYESARAYGERAAELRRAKVGGEPPAPVCSPAS